MVSRNNVQMRNQFSFSSIPIMWLKQRTTVGQYMWDKHCLNTLDIFNSEIPNGKNVDVLLIRKCCDQSEGNWM